ncbi:MAG: enoyl-CoA hydratase [Acetobacteraceae bacterium]
MQQPTRQIETTLDERPDGLVATVAISNPKRLNAMNTALMTEFVAAVTRLAENPRLRVLILTGAGEKAFIGGADIHEMAALGDPAGARAFITHVHDCCAALRAIQVPTIARIQGFTFGAGMEMAASCDLRVASETAAFGMPEVKLGIPSVIEAALLPSLVGWGRAREILLLGETFSAQQALAWHFLQRVTPPDQLDEAVETWVGQALSCAPGAVRLQKALLRAWEDLPLRDAIAAGIDSFAAAYDTDEPRRSMQHFLAARVAHKTGRR